MIERKGVRVDVDVGAVWVGAARCDPDDVLMMPVKTLIRQEGRSDIDHIGEIVDEFLVVEVIAGLPRHLKSGEGVSAKAARGYTLRIKALRSGIHVALVDEHLTSNQVHARLRASGISEKDRRPVIDQVAAQIILERALEGEHMSGCASGRETTLEGSSAQ